MGQTACATHKPSFSRLPGAESLKSRVEELAVLLVEQEEELLQDPLVASRLLGFGL